MTSYAQDNSGNKHRLENQREKGQKTGPTIRRRDIFSKTGEAKCGKSLFWVYF